MKLKKVGRSRALALMDPNYKGLSIDDTVKELQRRYHRSDSLEDVRSAYFPPKGGAIAIGKLEGMPHQALLDRLILIRRLSRQKSEQLSETMRRLHKDPSFAAPMAKRSSETLRRMNQDPEFEAKRVAGIRRYWKSRKEQEEEGGQNGKIGS